MSGAWCELGGRQCVVNVGMGAGPMGWARLEIAFLFVENVICTPVRIVLVAVRFFRTSWPAKKMYAVVAETEAPLVV